MEYSAPKRALSAMNNAGPEVFPYEVRLLAFVIIAFFFIFTASAPKGASRERVDPVHAKPQGILF